MKPDEVYKSMENCWQNFKGYTYAGKLIINSSEKLTKKMLAEIKLPKDAKILDLGCGTGRTIINFKSWGYKNIIGIDNSPASIQICSNRGLKPGKDVFLMDGTQSSFQDKTFDLIFEEGVLEHFEDFSPFIKEMSRLSNRYILLLQPNHYSLMGKLIDIAEHLCGRNVKEYSYHQKNFVKVLEEKGFSLRKTNYTPLHEIFALLFKRKK